MLSQAIKKRIQDQINNSNIFLYMKGTPLQPMCGFSAGVIKILNELDVPYDTFNVLSDLEIREGIKKFTDWPTIPQLYVAGQFVGGHDIIIEMSESGDLRDLLQKSKK